LNLLLQSVRNCRHGEAIELHVIGAGRSTDRWKKLALNLGLKKITWYGWVDKEAALEIMANCHLMCITSLSDLTSTVLLEGLSLGLPVVALNHCGFSNVITKDCGIKIPIGSRKEVCAGFSTAIDLLYEDEPLRLKLSQGARRRALDFKWEEKAKRITQLYEEAIENFKHG